MGRGITTTKFEIIQVASEFFFEVGYSKTSPNMIAKELGISTGNISYYFPTKEHLLKVLVETLCDYQMKMIEAVNDIGMGSVASICMETMTVAVACDESEIARDFFISAFESLLCRDYLRENHVERAKKIFAKECGDWTDEQFHQAELLVMGLQYAAIVPTSADIPVKTRVAGALNQVLSIYNVDEATRKKEIDKVLAKDCRGISKQVLEGFTRFVEKTNHNTLEEMIRGHRRRNKVNA